MIRIEDLRHIDVIKLVIEPPEKGSLIKHHQVLFYSTDDIGRMAWWPLFMGEECECNYFIDNFLKGIEHLKGQSEKPKD